jgi:hypothetical protein
LALTQIIVCNTAGKEQEPWITSLDNVDPKIILIRESSKHRPKTENRKPVISPPLVGLKLKLAKDDEVFEDCLRTGSGSDDVVGVVIPGAEASESAGEVGNIDQRDQLQLLDNFSDLGGSLNRSGATQCTITNNVREVLPMTRRDKLANPDTGEITRWDMQCMSYEAALPKIQVSYVKQKWWRNLLQQ